MKALAAFQSAAAFQSVAFLRSLQVTPSSTTQLHSTMVASYGNSTLALEPPAPRLSSALPPLPEHSRRMYLLRHGETDWNALGKLQGGGYDIPLNENGRRQAIAVAQALDDIPIGIVASSQLSRAKETAEILWKRHSTTAQKHVVDSGFAEMSFGEFEGLASRDPNLDPKIKRRLSRITKQVQQDVNFKYPGGGESKAQVAKRVGRALHKILEEHPEEKHVAIVSHSRTNKVLVASKALGDVRRFIEVQQSSKYATFLEVTRVARKVLSHAIDTYCIAQTLVSTY
jgi:broad specificity phosphatase PhoE